MKTLVSTLCLVLIATCITAQEKPAYFYNYAFSGMNLRSKAQVNSRVITRIPYGAKLEFLDSTGVSDKLGWVEGEWVKVRFRGRDGYVFGGYLLALKTPDKENSTAALSRALESFALALKEPGVTSIETVEGDVTHYYTKLTGSATLDTESDSGEFSSELIFASADLFDGYIILEALTKTNNQPEVLESLRFIKGKDGEIRKISNAQKTILIKQLGSDQVSIKLTDHSE